MCTTYSVSIFHILQGLEVFVRTTTGSTCITDVMTNNQKQKSYVMQHR